MLKHSETKFLVIWVLLRRATLHRKSRNVTKRSDARALEQSVIRSFFQVREICSNASCAQMSCFPAWTCTSKCTCFVIENLLFPATSWCSVSIVIRNKQHVCRITKFEKGQYIFNRKCVSSNNGIQTSIKSPSSHSAVL